jgi:hypothetical protein
MAGKEVTQYEAAGLDEKMRYVQTLTSAGSLIPKGLHDQGHPSPGKVLLVLETGAMLGIHPMAAMGGIHIIEGKATISPGLMSGLVRKAGHKLRVTTTGSIKGGDFAATATLTRSDDPDFTYSATWTIARAVTAGLAGKDVWKKYGEAMCKARSISEVCREGAEDCLMGVSYTPEEMGALVDNGGEMTQVPDAEPSEDWAALVAAAKTTADLIVLRDRAKDADEYTANRALFLARAGVLSRAEKEAAAVPEQPAPEPTPDENVIDAEVVEDETTAETEEERYERETAAEYAKQVNTDG